MQPDSHYMLVRISISIEFSWLWNSTHFLQLVTDPKRNPKLSSLWTPQASHSYMFGLTVLYQRTGETDKVRLWPKFCGGLQRRMLARWFLYLLIQTFPLILTPATPLTKKICALPPPKGGFDENYLSSCQCLLASPEERGTCYPAEPRQWLNEEHNLDNRGHCDTERQPDEKKQMAHGHHSWDIPQHIW